MSRARVVILGGGMAGLATAWELSQEDWRNRFESIVVYQRGWRLGGKGASSRGAHGRIEEHGLHVLLGYYDATFRVLREAYGELDRATSDPGCPIQTWREAFSPSPWVGLAESHRGAWSTFVTRFSTNAQLPGEPGAEDRPLRAVDLVVRSMQLLLDFLEGVAAPPDSRVYLSASPHPRRRPEALLRGGAVAALAGLMETMCRFPGGATGSGDDDSPVRALASVLASVRAAVREGVATDPTARRIWHLIDLVMTNLQGMVADGLVRNDRFDSIDHLDYRQWLRAHGADAGTVDSPIVRGMYDLTFAYQGGDRSRPGFAAGLGLQLASRMLFDFKGSLFWRMEAGMGEAVFAPLYQALRSRGVEFRFFHRLNRLAVGADRAIQSIHLTRQAESPTGRYDPLTRMGGLPCWPASPDSSQLTSDPGNDLESHAWAGPGCGPVRLEAGADFDVAVLAVSLGMVPHVAAELMAEDPRWRAMVEQVGTVATHSAQLWLRATEAELGWTAPAAVTLSGLGDSFDTWASMSHLLGREDWAVPHPPRSLAYLCGASPDPPHPGADVESRLVRFLEDDVEALWPKARSTTGFRWELLWDGEDRFGPQRLQAQYLRSGHDPSDRYVQSLPGSGRYRLAPGDTGYSNLVVAGDWTACGLDAGCLEAATRSGILAARAVSAAGTRAGVAAG